MARQKGSANFSGTIEALAGGALDARSIIQTKADLTASGSFPYPYIGMETYVVEENKKYRLIGDNTTNINNWQELEKIDDTLDISSINPVQNKIVKNAIDNKADLINGKVPSSQLPSYVDDIIEGYYNENNGKFYVDDTYTIEIPGESGKIYISLDTNFEYRWSGSAFVRVNEGVVLGETSETAYRGDRGKVAYDDSQINKTSIGDLTQLQTIAKSNLVAAINEAASSGGGSSIQVNVLPTPSAELVGKIYEYVGETTSNYTHGLFYECVQEPEEIVENSYVLPVQTTAGKDWFTIVIDFDQTVTTTRGVCKYRINGTQYNNTSSYAPLNLDVHEGDVLDFMTYSSGTTSLVCWKSLNTPIYWAVTNVDGIANIQVSTLPTASEKFADKIYQYVGESGVYTNGYFYKCVPHTSIVEHTLLVNDTNKKMPFQLKANVAQTVTFTKGTNFNVMYYYLNGVESPASGYHQRDDVVSVPVQIGDELKGTFNQNSATECTIRYVAEETHYQWEVISMEGVTISQVDFNALPQEAKNNGSAYYIYDSTPASRNTQTVTGYTPIGTIISVMGNSAPLHYLACDGSIVNITDYPELAAYFEQQFGEINHFGGNGETTFAVPDLRGEFLRGTGTNSHATNGDGANVGVHQDGTGFNYGWKNSSSGGWSYNSAPSAVYDNLITNSSVDGWRQIGTQRSSYVANSALKSYANTGDAEWHAVVRPTNTSVLYCIATKNIYINPENIYSTDETVVGQWIDGKPVYQKTIEIDNPPSDWVTFNSYGNDISNIKSIISVNRRYQIDNGSWETSPNWAYGSDYLYDNYQAAGYRLYAHGINITKAVITLQYTKTTD